MRKKMIMKSNLLMLMLCIVTPVWASNIVPIGHDNNVMYYKIGGASDFALPPVSDTDTIALDTNTNLGMGYNCSAYNPAISITNSMNNLQNSTDNLTKDIMTNITGSILQLPGYILAKQNPTLYALFNNYLLSAHKQLEVSTKSCQIVKDQIAQGQNPYQDWGTIAAGDQWKKKLSLISSNKEDINYAKKELDTRSGEDGVAWVNGKTDSDGIIRAGGNGNQPPVHVIADTVKAGYNALLNRNSNSDDKASTSGSSSELAYYFPDPKSAQNWITNVVGDQIITTCNSDDCRKKQGSIVGHGLLPWITSCKQDQANCAATIGDHLGKLVTGNESITKENLDRVSADGIAMSPDAISAIKTMDATQQSIIVNKLAHEIAVQRIINKALIARNILSTGAQIPVIAANHPAQVIIAHAITNLDNDIRSIAFESQIRKQMVTGTLSEVMSYANDKNNRAMAIPSVSSPSTIMENGAMPANGEHRS